MRLAPRQLAASAIHDDQREQEGATVMNWNGSWGWAWLFMIPMVLVMWGAIALVVVPWMRTGRDRRRSPIERVDDGPPPAG